MTHHYDIHAYPHDNMTMQIDATTLPRVLTVTSSFAPTETLIYLHKESICERLTAVAGPEMQDAMSNW